MSLLACFIDSRAELAMGQLRLMMIICATYNDYK